MKLGFLTAACLFAATSNAFATGGFSCEIDDTSLVFSTSGTTGRGMGGPIVRLEAAADIRLKGTPAPLAKLNLSEALVHHWLDHPDLRLHYYAETTGTEPFASAELVIKTVAVEGEDIVYTGDYLLKIYQAEPPPGLVTEDGVISAAGKVTCSGE